MMLLPNTTKPTAASQLGRSKKASYEGKASESDAFLPALDSPLQGPNGRYKQGLRVWAGDVGSHCAATSISPRQDLALSGARSSTEEPMQGEE